MITSVHWIDAGFAGQVLQEPADKSLANAKITKLRLDVLTWGLKSPAIAIPIALVVMDCVLHVDRLVEAISPSASLMEVDGQQAIEWEDSQGWRDRRILSSFTKQLFYVNGRHSLTATDVKNCKKRLGDELEVPTDRAFHRLIQLAQIWWSGRISNPLLWHASGESRIQLLKNDAWQRYATKLPQRNRVTASKWRSPVLDVLCVPVKQGTSLRTLHAAIAICAKAARMHGAKHIVKVQLVQDLDSLVLSCTEDGRAQLMSLGGLRHVAAHGDLAPTTLSEYCRNALMPIARSMLQVDRKLNTPQEWHSMYQEVISKSIPTQQGKVAAFIKKFHEFLVLSGESPLPKKSFGVEDSPPPCAAVVWPWEVSRSIDFVDAQDINARLKLQAKLLLALASYVPLRTYEPWCIRLKDVSLIPYVEISINPRVRDGVKKSGFSSRTEVVKDEIAGRLIRELYEKRIEEDQAWPEDDGEMLFGVSGVRDARYLCEETIQIVNAALKWSTGDESASMYDLRHAVLSTRWINELSSATAADPYALIRASSSSGHGSPMSTIEYVHQIELLMWAHCNQVSVEFGLNVNSSPPKSSVSRHASRDVNGPTLIPPIEFSSKHRELRIPSVVEISGIIFKLINDTPAQVVGNQFSLTGNRVNEICFSVLTSMREIGWVALAPEKSSLSSVIVLQQFIGHARAAMQPRHHKFSRLLDSAIANDISLATKLWREWCACMRGVDLCMLRPQSARLLSALQEIGIRNDEMAITHTPDMEEFVKSYLGSTIPNALQAVRRGQSSVRLWIPGSRSSGALALGKKRSLKGHHWLIILLGANLKLQGVWNA